MLYFSLESPVEVIQMGTDNIRGMFEKNYLFLSGDFKFQVRPKVLISSPRSTPRD